MTNLARIPPRQKEPTDRFSALETAYFDWLRREGECCLTGQPYFAICHIGGIADGKGMGRKSTCQLVLPMHKLMHRDQHKHPATFWGRVGLLKYRTFSEGLFTCFEQRISPIPILRDMQELCDREYVAKVMRKGL